MPVDLLFFHLHLHFLHTIFIDFAESGCRKHTGLQYFDILGPLQGLIVGIVILTAFYISDRVNLL